MPNLLLTNSIAENYKCPDGQKKIDLFDTKVSGLLLEVRQSGGRTYYLRYRNERQRVRLLKIARGEDLTVSQARQKAKDMRSRIALGKDPLEERKTLRRIPTFQQFIHDQYLPYIRSYKRSWQTDQSILKNHLLPLFSSRYLDEITPAEIRKMHVDRLQSGAAPGTANRLLVMMRFIYNLAIKWQVDGVTQNPTSGIPLFEENNKIERYLTKSDIERLYAAVKLSQNKMLRYIVPMLILTGARKNEVLQAKWNEFDLNQRLWRIPITKSGKARHVPLSDSMLILLETIRALGISKTYVLPNLKTGKPYSSIFYAWDVARKRAGLDDVRIHDLRHTFASLLVNNGRTLYEVQKLLGHSQIETTQRYAHLSQETLQDATNTATRGFDQIFG